MITIHAKHESQATIGHSHRARTIEKVPSTASAVENFRSMLPLLNGLIGRLSPEI